MLLQMRVIPPSNFKLDVYKSKVQHLPELHPDMVDYRRTIRWQVPNEQEAEEAYQWLWDAVRRLLTRTRAEILLAIRHSILDKSANFRTGTKGK